MRNKTTLKIAVLAIFLAIIAILTFVPYIGFIPLGFVSVTIIHVVVIIGAIMLGKTNGAILGLCMGVCSMLHSQIGTAQDLTFIWPWVSIIPRVIFGYVAGLLYEKIKIKNSYVKLLVVAVLSTIFHTLIVYVFYMPTFVLMYSGMSFFDVFTGNVGYSEVTMPFAIYCLVVFLFSCLFESILAGLVTPPVILAINKNKRITKVCNEIYK